MLKYSVRRKLCGNGQIFVFCGKNFFWIAITGSCFCSFDKFLCYRKNKRKLPKFCWDNRLYFSYHTFLFWIFFRTAHVTTTETKRPDFIRAGGERSSRFRRRWDFWNIWKSWINSFYHTQKNFKKWKNFKGINFCGNFLLRKYILAIWPNSHKVFFVQVCCFVYCSTLCWILPYCFVLHCTVLLYCVFVLYCIALYYIVLQCSAMYCIASYFIVLYGTHYTVPYRTVLNHIVLYCIVLYCIVLCYIVLYCAILYCIVLYCIVLCYIVLYCAILYCIVLYCIVLYCIVLYCAILYCIVLYCYCCM